MKQKYPSSLSPEGFLLLIEGSLSSIPFNIVLAILVGLDLVYSGVPIQIVSIWVLVISCLSIGRWVNSKLVIKKEYYKTKLNSSLLVFLLLTFSMGVLWGGSYFIFLPYISDSHESIILLVLGGMSAGAIASLSVYVPAYCAYVLPMFLPIIVYNFYLFQSDKSILATMCLLFIIMVFLTAKINSSLLHTNIRLGKEKDVLISEMTLTNMRLEKSISEVRTMSITDSLTGLYNRRYFDMVFSNELGRAKRDKYPISLIFIDVDNFKYINDTYGHPSGDDFLIYVANSLRDSIRRANDTVFRLGGDEFAAILSNMASEDVLVFCELIQEAFNKYNQYKNVTLSMGIICISALNALDHQSIITAADRTLYQAKKAGKNMIMSKVMA